MNSKRQIDYLKIFKLLFAVISSIFFFNLFFHHFGQFIFYSPYEQFVKWYPNHYNEIYTSLQVLKVISAIAFAFLLWKFRAYFYELSLAVVALYTAPKLRIQEAGNYSLQFSLNYKKHFLITQISIFIAAIISYFVVQKFYAEAEQFSTQLFISRAYILVAIATFLIFFYINLEFFSGKINQFLFSSVTPYNLAVYRILFFLILVYYYLIYGFHHIQYVESKPREPLPFIGWLIDIIPITKDIYFYACVIGLISCVFLICGLFTRVFLIINAVIIFYVISVPNFYGKLWHSQLPIWISWFLLFAPVSDVFSLDRFFFKRKEPLVKSPDYNFPIKIIWLQMGLIYFWAGFYKLIDCGFDWSLGPSMINQVRLEWFEHFDKIPFIRIDKFPALLHIGGLVAILFELVFLFLLFHKKLKHISIIGGLIMHNIIGVFMYISFVLLQIQYIVFLNLEKILIWYKKRVPSFSYQSNIPAGNNSLNKKMVVTSCLIVGMNFIFGMAKISSFPFSVYPTYSENIPGHKEFLHYTVLDSGKQITNVWELGKNSDFRWEDFTRLEYAIIRKYYERKVADTLAISNQWKWWTNHFAELKGIDSIDVYIYKRSLNPDSAQVILKKEYLMRIFPQKE